MNLPKIIVFVLVSLPPITALPSQAVALDKLTCSVTKLKYGAEPEMVKNFPFEKKPGYLPAANGSFSVHRDIAVEVSSMEIAGATPSNGLVVSTSIAVKKNGNWFRTSFRSERDEQHSYIQMDNFIISCGAK